LTYLFYQYQLQMTFFNYNIVILSIKKFIIQFFIKHKVL
jgi:hypothetical protein